ncbi:EAL domain-containing protein [Arcobacter sp. YIC-310]|uniref:EAL domain-containing protein n=1 Tax=Arcobacter sp. YIC-310 TaxID=3376632 RepID=UPI003C14E89A
MKNKNINSTFLENEVIISPKEYDNILTIQHEILNMIAEQKETQTILDMLCILAETLLPNSVASIMMIDENKEYMNVLAAPSIPKEAQKELNFLKPGPNAGSCGTAVFTNEAVFVKDVKTDKRWEDLKELVSNFSLCSCWSMPIRNENRKAIGSFALTSFEKRAPSIFHKKLLEISSSIVSIILKNQENEEKSKYLAYYDNLTSLKNKSYFEKLIYDKKFRTLLLLNINNFNYINTAYGFTIGDKLLKKLAKILKEKFASDNTFRFNSDEFALLYEEKIDIKEKIKEIKEYFFSNSINIKEIKINLTFCIGAVYDNKNLLRNSSLSLRKAKELGKNRSYILEKNTQINYETTQSFINATNLIREAIDKNSIIPFYQGIHDNKKNVITKYEVLVRIKKESKIISPSEFLEAAKLSGLLPDITKIIIDKSFEYMSKNSYMFSINITEEDLSKNYLISYLKSALLIHNIKPYRLTLEILEGVSSTGKKNHIKQLKAIKELGIKLAIDDFGREYSNFERLIDLDIDSIKIDAKYIKDIDTNKKSYEITKALSSFAKGGNISCIAEYVYTREIQEVINSLGIDYSQGYLFSKPCEKID